jgi:nickel-dependent lactate racemase
MAMVRLAYGKSGLELRLPEGADARVFRSRACPGIPAPQDAVRQALEKPIASRPLSAVARGRTSACVVISDITRPVPNRLILPPTLAAIEAAGVPREAITILIATGIHRPNLGDELVELVGPEIAANYRVENHYSKDMNELRFVGQTSAGIPIYVNRRYLDADLKVLTGFIEPHLWAGYSGGRKAILPGISSLETMKHMHGCAMIDDPGTHYGNLVDNPFHEAGLEVAGRVGVDFIVNVVLNDSKQITGVFAGHCREAHLAGCRFCEQWVVAEIDEPVDLAITCAGGYPLDKTLYQSVKGMSGAAPIVKPGGTILVATRCDEQAGSPEFTSLLDRAESVENFFEMIRRPDFFEVDQWIAQEMYQILREKRIAIYSEGLTPQQIHRYLLDPVADLQAYVDAFVARAAAARIAVIPEGPYVITRLQAPTAAL